MSITNRLNDVQRIPADYLKEMPPLPKSVKIELVASCNYACLFCSHRVKKDQKDMEWSLFSKISTELKELGIKEIGPFLIGEPFMNPKLLIKAVSFLKNDLNIPYVFLTSNASLAKPEIVEELMKAGLDSLKWSTNFADWDQFTAFTQRPAKQFILAKRNIEAAWQIRQDKRYNTKLYASSILYDSNQPKRINDFLDKHIKPNVDEFYWLPFYSFGGKVDSLVYMKNNEKKITYTSTRGNTGGIVAPLPAVPCWTLFTAAHIMSDGVMTACCTDSNGEWAVGDLKKDSFMTAWWSEKFKSFRRAHIENKIKGTLCEKCIYG